MFGIFEQTIYKLRDFFWDYPDLIFFGPNSVLYNTKEIYFLSRPFSHIASVISLLLVFTYVISLNVQAFLRIDKSTFIEGVIVGVDDTGELKKLSRINPIVSTNIQLEEDLSELIYENLVDIGSDGKVIPVLADYLEISQGKEYQFKLLDNVNWHDGVPLTTADVKATFDILRDLDQDPNTSTVSSRAANNIELTIIDDKSFKMEINGVIPAFFEAISFKIMPAHMLTTATAENFATADPIINRRPIGTGPYKFGRATTDTIELVLNQSYRNKSQISGIQFKLFKDQETAVKALQSGQIHALSGLSNKYVQDLQKLNHLQVYQSSVIYNQYWALHFNLAEGGSSVLKDIKVRQAVASAINKQRIISTLIAGGEQAYGPIPVNSFAYVKQSTFEFDKQKAEALLDEAGWVKPNTGLYRQKDNAILEFGMVVVDNPDRLEIAEIIRQDLEDVGVKLNVQPQSLLDIKDQYLVTRQYNSILYGVETFIDPDRYELYHSSEIISPGLNISSYVSPNTVLVVEDGEQKKIPEVDDLLDDGRKLTEQQARKLKYDLFASIIASEVPAVFLFHPKETYVVNKRLSGITLNNILGLENRFNGIAQWTID